MAEDILKKISIPDLVVGVTIGFILGYTIAKKTIGNISSMSSDSNLSSLNLGIQQLGDRLRAIEQRLDIPSPPQIPLSLSSIPLSISPTVPLNPNLNPMNLEEENDEDFTIKKDEKGRMCGANFHRRLFIKK